MYDIKNGRLRRDGEEIFAVGESYYPSFHHAKYPVPPEGDRIGEMKKDLKLMRELGINHVRIAAIGLTKLDENGKVTVDTPFVDAVIEEAEHLKISISVRIQGYVLNLHGYKNVLMIDADGNEQDTSRWFDFIQTTLHHDGMLTDNMLGTKAISEHFADMDNVVAFQIYNEPHYPIGKFFDYHPCAIAAYRRWLVENGIMTDTQARNYEPPRKRKEQSANMWALWRIFCRDSLTKFLCDSSRYSKETAGKPTYTCLTTCQSGTGNAYRGIDTYTCSDEMDITGYTNYISAQGADYYTYTMTLDMHACAAAACGKTSWCVELDSRTKIPPFIFNQNTYAALGSGLKGIIYYQWRGDYPSEATPIPNGCGLVNYDGTKCPNFDNAAAMIKLLNELSPLIMNADRDYGGIGILHSDYAAFYCDALENDEQILKDTTRNSAMQSMCRIYTDLRKQGYSPFITDASHLLNGRVPLNVLFVPAANWLCDEEKAVIEKFISAGGTVYEVSRRSRSIQGLGLEGYRPYLKPDAVYEQYMQIEDICADFKKPVAVSDNYAVPIQVLEGPDYKLLCVTNISCPHRTVLATIHCNFTPLKAVLYTNTDSPRKLRISGDDIITGELLDGGIIEVR